MGIHQFDLPPLGLRKSRVHAEKIRSKQSCLFSSGSRSYLKEYILGIQRILGGQKKLKTLYQLFLSDFQFFQFSLSQIADIGIAVAQKNPVVPDLRFNILILGVSGNNIRQFKVSF